MKTYLIPLAIAAMAYCVSLASADIQPGHLVAGPIAWDGSFAIGEVYVGGTYGQTVKGGRTAHLEFQDAGKGWLTLTSVVLPDIGPKRFYIASPLGGPRKGKTTIRLRITPASSRPDKDVSTRTFLGLVDGSANKLSRMPRLDFPGNGRALDPRAPKRLPKLP